MKQIYQIMAQQMSQTDSDKSVAALTSRFVSMAFDSTTHDFQTAVREFKERNSQLQTDDIMSTIFRPGLHIFTAPKNVGKTYLLSRLWSVITTSKHASDIDVAILTASELSSELPVIDDFDTLVSHVLSKFVDLTALDAKLSAFVSAKGSDDDKAKAAGNAEHTVQALSDVFGVSNLVSDITGIEQLINKYKHVLPSDNLSAIIGNAISRKSKVCIVDSISSITVSKEMNTGSYMTGGQALQATEWYGFLSNIFEKMGICVLASFNPRDYTGQLPDWPSVLPSAWLLYRTPDLSDGDLPNCKLLGASLPRDLAVWKSDAWFQSFHTWWRYVSPQDPKVFMNVNQSNDSFRTEVSPYPDVNSMMSLS